MEFLVHNISHSDLVVELSWLRSPEPPVNGSANGSTDTTGSGEIPEPKAVTPVANDDGGVDVEGATVPRSVLARPKFSLFQQISQQILERVQELHHPPNPVASNGNTPTTHASAVLTLHDQPATAKAKPETPVLHPSLLDIDGERWKARCHDTQSPIGFNLADCPIAVARADVLRNFQLRGEVETTRLIEHRWDRVGITAVYFPLVALLLPKWTQVLTEFQSQGSKQLVYLMSGAGIPRNTTHARNGNSTEITAQLIALFVRQYYPQMEAIQVHSGSNIFRFDDNVQFMTRELRPLLEAHREALVDRCGEAWKAHFHVTIAYADGPPARLSALNASLRIYRPSYLHIWQLKTFWHQRKLSMADVDFHAFENIEASPCVAPSKADALTQTLVKEMRLFRDQFLAAEGQGEVESFWLRKSRKPVLAVLLVEKPATTAGQRPQLVVQRGMNCEVSMPTGSLCAERNAIGSALASDPTLSRRDLKMIGVLSLNLNAGSKQSKQSAGATSGRARRNGSVDERGGSDGERQDSGVDERASPTFVETSASNASSSHDQDKGDDKALGDTATLSRAPAKPLAVRIRPPSVQISPLASPLRQAETEQTAAKTNGAELPAEAAGRSVKRPLDQMNANLTSPRKPKRPRTFSFDEMAVEELMRAEAAAAPDRNPLAPCGACKEWLVKIAEANPSFRVVTFENARCRNVYINQLM